MRKLSFFFLMAFTLLFYTTSLSCFDDAEGVIARGGRGGGRGSGRGGGGDGRGNVGKGGNNRGGVNRRGVGSIQRTPSLSRAYVAGRAVGASNDIYAAPYYYYPSEPYYYYPSDYYYLDEEEEEY